MTTVLMVSGSWPPQPCGVGDYAATLADGLVRAGVNVHRYSSSRFAAIYSRRIITDIARQDCDLVHIQYPTVGYGRSLTPSLIARGVSKPVVVTMHEYSVFRRYRRPWFAPFARDCSARIFTSAFERELFQARFPRRSGIDATIGIGSNIPRGRPVPRRADKVVYFGLVTPHKGIEEFLDFCVLVRAQQRAGPERDGPALALIGSVPAPHRGYADEILHRARVLGVAVLSDLSSEQVANELAGASFAYLPFPDGASVKRGSLAAVLVNGVATVTRHGKHTPEWMREATLHAPTPQEAVDLVMALRRDDADLQRANQRTQIAARQLSWDAIAEGHIALYEQIFEALAHSAVATGRETRCQVGPIKATS